MLRLEVLDFSGPTRWRWRLTDADGGRFLADHVVELDEGDWQYEAFTALGQYLLLHAAPDRRLSGEAQLTAQVGEWIGERVLGPVAPALAKARRPVRLEVPPGAEVLAYRPWELATIGGRPLALQKVNFVIDQFGGTLSDKQPVGDRLRMLAVFSLPEDVSALNLRRERHALARLVQEIAATNGRAVELRVLQYGATRTRLENVLLEEEGWDVLHISGHGLPAGLLLEDDSGRRDLISSRELVDLLDLTSDQLKLVTLSTCESAAVTAAEHLRLLGLRPPDPAADPAAQPPDEALPALATELVRRLDCAVLAMRYPVVDDFAIALADSFYNLALGKGQPVAQALGLTLPRVVPETPTASAPALSVTTPALFGLRAAGLKLEVPPGRPVVFQAEEQKLAAFPPQPQRFVGRVGPMTRATAALAPRSGRAGVLFHGMAGAGKTACALELAYTHENGFARLVWHVGPPEGDDITAAMTAFALDLEAQLPGLKLAHLVDDTVALQGFLPMLTEFLERNRVLLVLDNLESLLTEKGEWRDQRWELMVNALTGHHGFSRVVLTSRRRAASLPVTVLVEPVHALSLTEAVLLAREWKHLRSLIDGEGSGLNEYQSRALAARTMAVVQGHPKLIELADGQAIDPAALQVRLDDADQMWIETGTRLETFLQRDDAFPSDDDYLRVLDGWTRGITKTLPDASAALFGFLCCLEPDDRVSSVVEATWTSFWQRLKGLDKPAPDLDAATIPLLEQALVAVDRVPESDDLRSFDLHPGVAETGRVAGGSDIAVAVDAELADFWVTVLASAREREVEDMGALIRRSALAAAPYLVRQQRWDGVLYAIESLLSRDSSPAVVAAVLPHLNKVRESVSGTDLKLRAGGIHARALKTISPARAAAELRQLLDDAVADQEFAVASTAATDLVNLYGTLGHFEEAFRLTEEKKELSRQAGFGPWTQLGDDAHGLQILAAQGKGEEALAAVERLRALMSALPESSDQLESSVPWNVRELVFDVGRQAAVSLGRWELALEFGAENLTSKKGRGASESEKARAVFNDYFPLTRLGRIDDARTLLRWCLVVFESEHDLAEMGGVLAALADVEDESGHVDLSIELEKNALRLSYAAGNSDDVASSHANIATYLAKSGGPSEHVWAHRLAALLIRHLAGGSRNIRNLFAFAQHLTEIAAPPLTEFIDVCRVVDQIEGVRLADLVARLPGHAIGGQAALDELLAQARAVPVEAINQIRGNIAWWEPVVAGLVAADRGDVEAARAVAGALNEREAAEDWRRLVAVLRRVSVGERSEALLDGLDLVDKGVVKRVLDALAGAVVVDLQAWRVLTESAGEAVLSRLIESMVNAANGDTESRASLQQMLAGMSEDPEIAPTIKVLRGILDGNRQPSLALLDPAGVALVTKVLDRLNSSTAEEATGPVSGPPG
ncbi:CHAT domain-containing protein [Actinoplanes bogorensis]|uniref:CHAT domain-containing protein n=1 Tax=Paractinoplanes bogorensis TaxID=1610840 RepID=A0ABS5YYP6_9ACTN|nr:CHAT domain-containing protein [Actinoplanes bogorensis]MBU2668211.1 CHAT domain-containing protein [Actinoplanes bogorensis]